MTQAEAAQGTSLVEDTVQALLRTCATNSQTMKPNQLVLDTRTVVKPTRAL